MPLRTVLRAFLPCLLALPAFASPKIACSLEQGGDELQINVPTEADALHGSWLEMGEFRFRTLLAAPARRRPWLLVEVYARAADGDERIVSAQKVFAPFATGQVEVVEPRLGRILRYVCGKTR